MHPPRINKAWIAGLQKRLPAMVMILGLIIGLEWNLASTARSSSTPDMQPNRPVSDGYAAQLHAAFALETRAYKTNSTEDYRAASVALEACSRLHPEDLHLHRSLGYLYLDKLKQPDLAFPHLQAVYAATPEAPGWGELLAKAAGETGRSQLQIQVLKEVAARQPHDPWCRLDLANALAQAHRYDEAEEAFQDAIRIDPNEEWINVSYAQFLKSRGQDSEAERIARKVLASHPKSAAAMTLLGDIYQDNSEFAGARSAYNQAMSVEPGYPPAQVGLGTLEHSELPQLKSSGYAFAATDKFFQSGSFNTLTVPVLDHLSITAAFDAGWFHNNTTTFPSARRYEEGLGVEYRLNNTLQFDGGASAFEVGHHDVLGFNLGATWTPTRDFWIYGAYRNHDPITDSIATVSDGLAQNIGIIESGYQISDNLYAMINASRADYSDGNVRNFVHVEPATYTLWKPIQLQVGPVYELIDYQAKRPSYSSPSGYQTYGPMIQVEPYILSWLSIKARYEPTYGTDGSKWGTIIAAGPAVHLAGRFDCSAEYLYYQVPGAYSNYSGNGFRAALSWRF